MPIQSQGDAAAEHAALATLRPVLEVLKNINSELNLRKLLTTILDTMIRFGNARRGTIVIFKGDKYKAKISRDRAGRELDPSEMGVSHAALRLVREKGAPVISSEAKNDPDLDFAGTMHHLEVLSLMCLPLRVKTRLIGAVYLDNPDVASAFGARETEIAEVLTEHAAISIENSLLHRQTIHDRLTKAYNHGYFEQRIQQEVARARRAGKPCGVLMIDLDDFKEINDTLGHEAGNIVLKYVAKTLSATVRGADLVARIPERPLVARYGGDEFEILLPETGREGALRTAERLVEALSQNRLAIGEQKIRLSISAGAAVFPDHAATARELQLRADEALYVSKRSGKNRAVLYSPRRADPDPRNR